MSGIFNGSVPYTCVDEVVVFMLSVLTHTQSHPEGARAAGESLHLPDGKEVGQSEEEIQGRN